MLKYLILLYLLAKLSIKFFITSGPDLLYLYFGKRSPHNPYDSDVNMLSLIWVCIS